MAGVIIESNYATQSIGDGINGLLDIINITNTDKVTIGVLNFIWTEKRGGCRPSMGRRVVEEERFKGHLRSTLVRQHLGGSIILHVGAVYGVVDTTGATP